MPSTAIVLIISSLVSGRATAGSFEDAIKEYESGEYIAAYQLIKPLAEKGNPDAQLMLGFMYDQGRGVPQDYDEMEKWYRRAAKQGQIAAQSTLRLMEERSEMEKWYRGGAEPGNASAQAGPRPEVRSGVEKWYRG